MNNKMKKILIAVISVVFILSAAFLVFKISNKSINVKGFTISGTKLLDANGNEFVIRGINQPHNWYKPKDEASIAGIAKTGANSVRIVLSNGTQYTKDSLAELEKLIALCEKNKLVAIVEVHDATGKDDLNSLIKAAEYWIEMKSALQGHEDTVILNIANEWCAKWDSNLWANGYKKVIPMLRKAGIKNTLMVDCGGYGQYPKSVADKGQEVLNADSEKNVIFSIHLYEYAGANANDVKSNISSITNKGLAVCVGEFGYKHRDGEVDEEAIIKYCKENKIGYIPWSWSGNSDGVEYLDLVNNFNASSYTEWGDLFFNTYKGMSDSKICTVFDNTKKKNK